MQFAKSIAALAAFVATAAAIPDRVTFFSTGGEVGVCGKAIQDSNLVVALSPENFENGARCGQVFIVEHGEEGVAVEVGDLCNAYTGNQIDLTEAAFEVLAPLSEGAIEVTYEL
ncbi:hypothetical protein B0H19DRAFT_1062642 [Mycena capillaripes]|nr:hypothetical protein B0H19DRAFT_1062642 [Mycena capillaripes]